MLTGKCSLLPAVFLTYLEPVADYAVVRFRCSVSFFFYLFPDFRKKHVHLFLFPDLRI